MWRVRWSDGTLSDIVNITRAKDAIACHAETVDRRQRRAAQPRQRPLVSYSGQGVSEATP